MNADKLVTVDLDAEELEIWIAGLREAPEEVPREEFESRVGTSWAGLDQIRDELKAHRGAGGSTTVTISAEQLAVVHRCLVATVEGLGVEEFHTRVGYSWETGQRVLGRLAALVASV